MAASKMPFTITYRKPGTSPPIFLAGSFSEPEWQPQEMDCVTGDDGEHDFKAQINVEPGKEYQFKVRIGEGDWWALAENYPVVTDETGNQNNLLMVPTTSNMTHTAPIEGNLPSTDSIADSKLPPSAAPRIHVPETDDNNAEDLDLKTPLFAHECFGAYELPDDDSDLDIYEKESPRQVMRPKSKDLDVTNVDINDPTLEKFPSDRTSILDALRTIQTHLGEDHTQLRDIPLSPRVVASSAESIDENALSTSPLSSTSSRRRDSRPSHSSFGRSRSAVSLGSIQEDSIESIEEESKSWVEAEQEQKPPIISHPNPKTNSTSEGINPSPSVEDEAIVMRSSEVMPKEKASDEQASQITSNEAVNGQYPADSGSDRGRKPLKPITEITATEIRSEEPISEPSNKLASTSSTPASAAPAYDTVSSTRPDRVSDGEDAKENPVVAFWRALFNRLFSNKLNALMTTGVAFAVGLGWWKGVDKQAKDAVLV
ncbi:hypothetical protein G7046_g330 [Stylonectria norvegica]|nr:hypothetical protein G7046_g330 [Stylonectria norvegica]